MKVERQAYNPAEIAELLGVSRRTVYSWIKAGHLRAVKVGPKLWLVPVADFETFTRGREVSAAAAPPAAAPSVPVEVPQAAAPSMKPMAQPGKKKRRR